MATLVRQLSNSKNAAMEQHRTIGMTLVEVMVSLAVVAFVFTSLTQMTFNSLRQAKKLELQDKMRSYATEAVQVIYNTKDSNWQGLGGFTQILPAATGTSASQAFIAYGDKTTLEQINQVDCAFDAQANYLVGNTCDKTIPPETGDTNKIFGRIVVRTDTNTGTNDSENDADVQVIVACIQSKCNPSDFPPFLLSLRVFRTGGSQ